MIKVDGKTISIPRGDSGTLPIDITAEDGLTPYPLTDQDRVILTVKASAYVEAALITKEMPGNDTGKYTFVFAPEDTKGLSFGDYVWDIRVVFGNGDVHTITSKETFKVLEVVGNV